MMPEDKDKFTAKEAQARFEAALRGGLKTPPKPLKDMQKKAANVPKNLQRARAAKGR
jgi:hypothetical protein